MDPMTGLIYSEFQTQPIGVDRYAMQGIKMGKRVVHEGGEYYRFAAAYEKTENGVFTGIDKKLLEEIQAANKAKLELAKEEEDPVQAKQRAEQQAKEEQESKKRKIIIDAKWEKQKQWLEGDRNRAKSA
jgi:hypothetical protein